MGKEGTVAIIQGLQNAGLAVTMIGDSKTKRSSLTDLQTFSRLSPGTETFAQSLRKYDSLSPDRSISSDLVQRLLAYTQAKNFSKSSYHTSDKVYFPINNFRRNDVASKAKFSKGVQTRSRRRYEIIPDARHRDKIFKSYDEMSFKKPPKKTKSILNETRNIRHFEEHINATYDYLKSVSRRHCRAVDVRYLTDVTRCLRDTLRGICDDTPVACPNMESRYSHHVRQHHNDGVTSTHRQSCPGVPKICCFCRKPVPCPCRKTLSTSSSEEFEMQLERAVMDWLQDIPVYPNDNNVDNQTRENLARKLVDKLKNIGDENFLDKSKVDIAECVDNMPMWCPGYYSDYSDRNMFKEQIIDNLVDRLRCIVTNLKPDKLEAVIKKWIGSLHFKSDGQEKIVNKSTMSCNLIKKLKPLLLDPPSDKEDYKVALKYDLINFLDELPIEINDDRNKTLNKLAEDLAMQLKDSSVHDVSDLQTETIKLNTEVEDEIAKWVDNLDVNTTDDRKQIMNKNLIVDDLVRKLKPYTQNASLAEENLKNIIKKETNEVLENFSIKPNGDKDEVLSILANNLTRQLQKVTKVNPIGPLESNSTKNKDSRSFKRASGTVSDISDAVNSFTNKTRPLPGIIPEEENLEDVLKNNIIDALKVLPMTENGDRNKVADDLVKILLNKTNNDLSNLPISSKADQTFQDPNFQIRNHAVPSGSTNVNDTFYNNFKSLNPNASSKDVDIATRNEIMDVLKELPIKFNSDKNPDLNEIADYLNNLVQNVMNDEKPNLNSDKKFINHNFEGTGRTNRLEDIINDFSRPRRSITFNNEENAAKDQISGTLHKSPIEINDNDNTGKFSNTISNKLAKNDLNQNQRSHGRNLINGSKDLTGNEHNSQSLSINIPNYDIQKKNRELPVKLNGNERKVLNKFEDINTPFHNRNTERSSESLSNTILGRNNSSPSFDNTAKSSQSPLRNSPLIREESLKSIKDDITRVIEELPIRLNGDKDDLLDQLLEMLTSEIQGPKVKNVSKPGNSGTKKRYDNLKDDFKKSPINRQKNSAQHEFKDMLKFTSINQANNYKNLDRRNNLQVAEDDNLDQDLNNDLQYIPNEKSFQNNYIINNDLAKASNIEKVDETDEQQNVFQTPGTIFGTLADNQHGRKIVNMVTSPPLSPPNQRKRWSKKTPQNLFESLKEEISDILEKSTVSNENRDGVVSALADILVDQGIRGESDSLTKNRLISALEDVNLYQDQSEDLVSKILDTGKEFTLSYKPENSNLTNRENPTPPMQTTFSEHPHEICDSIEKTSTDSRKNMKDAAHILANKLGDIMLKRGITFDGRQGWMEDKIFEYLENLPNSSIEAPKSSTPRNLQLKTSTPKRLSKDRALSFKPVRNDDLTISTIDDISLMKTPPIKGEREYLHKLLNVIYGWMDKLPLKSNSYEEKKFKDMMAADLADDIIDRQKYLQLNPDATTTDEEELEHLKYQIFRWLNKLPDMKNLMPSMSNTAVLMEKIKAIPVPRLTKPKRSVNATEEFPLQYLEKDLTSVQDEIWNWFEAIPSKYKSSTDDNFQRKNVINLTTRIDKFYNREKVMDVGFEDIVSDWLQGMLKETNKEYVSSLIEGLKAILQSKGLIPHKIKANGRKHSISADGIKAAILGWSQNTPSKSGNSIELEDKERDDIISTGKVVMENDPDNLKEIQKKLEEEIKTFLKQLPPRNDDIYFKELSRHLHELDNMLQMYGRSKSLPVESVTYIPESVNVGNISAKSKSMPVNNVLESDYKVTDDSNKSSVIQSSSTDSACSQPDSKAKDFLYKAIKQWCNDIPDRKGNTPEETEKVNVLKQNIASKLIKVISDLNLKPEIFYNDSVYENRITEEVDNLIKILPTSSALENNYPARKNVLLNIITKYKHLIENDLTEDAHKQQIHDAISQSICEPIGHKYIEEQVPIELLIDDVADAFIELNYCTESNDEKNKLKNKIIDKVIKFSNDYLSRHPDSPIDPKKLNKDLFDKLQKIPNPKDEIVQSEIEQLRIKDSINDWLKELPLKDDKSLSSKMERNKMVNVLAKDIYDIDRDKEINHEESSDNRKTIVVHKWIEKLALKPGEEANIDQMVDKLLSKLKDFDKAKKNISKRNSLPEDSQPSCLCAGFLKKRNKNECICRFYSTFDDPKSSTSSCRNLSQYVPPFPSSTLNTEDRAHLHRIRERRKYKRKPAFKPRLLCYCKDASVNPIPLDAGSQTEVGPWLSNQHDLGSKMPEPAANVEAPTQPLSPQVIVKEYHWDDCQQNASHFVRCPSSQSRCCPRHSNLNSWLESQPDQSSRFIHKQSSTQQITSPNQMLQQQNTEQLQKQGMGSPALQNRTCGPTRCTPLTNMPSPCMTPSCVQSLSPPISSMRRSSPESPVPDTLDKTTGQNSGPQTIEPRMQSTINSPAAIIPPCMISGVARRPPCGSRGPCEPGSPYERRSPLEISTSPCGSDVPQRANSRSFGLRVTQLGSFDNAPYSKTCGSQSPKPKRSRLSDKDFDWSTSFPDQTDYWGTPMPRRRVYKSSAKGGTFMIGRERCRCKEHVLTNESWQRQASYEEDAQSCPKCCGSPCPHPSPFFFK